jgi:PAS domain S-box-containing protein
MQSNPEEQKPIKESEESYRSLIEASLDPLVTISTGGKITDMNEALANITGITREKLTGTDFFDYFTEPQKAREVYQEVFAKGSVADSPLTLRHKDGKLTDVLFNGSVYKNDKGDVLGAVVVARDIAEQKWATELRIANKELAFQNGVKEKRAAELVVANEELAFQNDEKEKRAAELFIANKELAFQNDEKEKRAAELVIANKELAFQNDEKEKRAAELAIANKELAFQNDEKEKRAAELAIANKELAFQNVVKEKRAAELVVANEELAFQNDEKEKRAAELFIANKELAFQNDEKEKRAAELAIANKELAFQNDEKEKRAAELAIANKELAFQNVVKEKRAAELVVANEELAFQNDEKEKRAAELFIANKELAFQNDEKEKRAAELAIANKELAFQNDEKEKRAAELAIANKELAFQNVVKEKRAAELVVANEELAFQNNEKEKRAAELFIANKELLFQTGEKEKRAAELVIADIELAFQNKEKEKREIANKELEAFSYSAKLASQYSLSLIEASLDPLVTINTEGKITDMNEATVNIVGLSREKIKGTDFFDYFTEPQKAREVYQEVFAKGSVADSPLTLRHNEGKLTEVLFNGSVYKDDRGNELGVVIVARDVTAQKRFENELIEAKSIAERERQIAVTAVKSKQQFLSNMSHEIRTPMNAIIGFTKVVLKTELNEKQKEYLNAIKISGDALIVLINDILDLAKVDAGKMTFVHAPFKLSASISAMLHLFETKIQEKNLELIKQYDLSIPDFIEGDAVRLHQIILNLVGNAVKFTSKGKITVAVRLTEEDADNVTIEFAVTDTGIGIADSKMGNIFDDFQQATSETSRLYGGTGLGLAIVKQLVEHQGGKIVVKSKVNEGSTFSFTLPFKKTKAKSEPEINLEVEQPEAGLQNVKILVVEDISLNQLLMKTLIEEFGFELDIAANGKIALDMMQSNSYDIILMDLQMPEMNGFEATQYIRNTMLSKIPIIALTADVTTIDVEKCKAVGMDDYISKPIDEKLLYSKLVQYLKKPGRQKNIPMKKNEQTTTHKCTNLNYLRGLTKNNAAMIQEMIEVYLEETPQLVQKMKDAIESKDWHSLKSAAHSILPSFSTMGMDKSFENAAKAIQENSVSLLSGESGGKTAIELQLKNKELFSKIELSCAEACTELKKELPAKSN